MTVQLTGAGGLMVKLGHIFGRFGDAAAYVGNTANARVLSGATLVNAVATLEADYAAGTADYATIEGIQQALTSQQGNQNGWLTYLASPGSASGGLAQRTVISMVNADSPQLSKDLKTALQVLVQQMTGVASINASSVAVGAQTAVGTPNGNPVLVGSTKRGDGLVCQTIFPETLTFLVTKDSQGGATLNQESLSVVGAAALDPKSYLWPGGSGVSATMSLVDAQQNNAGGNLLQNSDFTSFSTANVPDNWTLVVGAAGTDVFNGGSANAYSATGGGSLQFTGTGSALLDAVTQQFATTPSSSVGGGGTAAKLTPNTQYALNLWLKTSATPAAGVAEFALIDGGGNVVNDSQSVANSATKSLTAVSTSFVNVNAVFRTPALLPSTVKLRIRLSTAIDSGKSVYFARVALTPMGQLYAGGPSFAGFSANTKVLVGDSWTSAVTNTYGLFAQYLERAFGMRALGVQLPYAGSPTISDSLIV